MQGSQTLAVRGRKSGEMRSNPVNPFELNGRTYLLAPRGTTQWVRNLRVAKEGELRSGRKVRHFTAEEVPDSDKLPLMRLYMDKWSWEVKGFLGIDAEASDEEIERILPGPPGFRAELRLVPCPKRLTDGALGGAARSRPRRPSAGRRGSCRRRARSRR